jgi:hypothetical protein
MSFPTPSWLEEAMRKYRQKLNHVRLRSIYTSLVPIITEKQAVAQANQTQIKDKIKTILDVEGILSDFHTSYYCYGYALDKSQRTMAFMVDRIREHVILRQKWETRGLDPAILDKLDAVLIFAFS